MVEDGELSDASSTLLPPAVLTQSSTTETHTNTLLHLANSVLQPQSTRSRVEAVKQERNFRKSKNKLRTAAVDEGMWRWLWKICV